MSRMTFTGSFRDPKRDLLAELDIDELVDKLTPGEIQRFLDECDPDDSQIPASLRSNYKCDKEPTGPLDRKKLLDFISEQALNTPDIPDNVPFVPGALRGKKWVSPIKPGFHLKNNDGSGGKIDIGDLGDEFELALSNATTDEVVDLAGILGLHSLMNQDQFHASQSDVWAEKADPSIGWNGTTKATTLKIYPDEAPNSTTAQEIIEYLKNNDPSTTEANLNNVSVSEEEFLELFDALRHNNTMTNISLSNTSLGDFAACNLAACLESNTCLEKLNIESNKILPPTLVKIFEAINVQQVVTEICATNQQSQFLGNKVEMGITRAVENNKTLLRVGLHFEYCDCRNRVAVQLQKNLDRVRLKRIALRMQQNKQTSIPTSTSGSRTGGYLGGLPGQILNIPRQKSLTSEDEDDEEENSR